MWLVVRRRSVAAWETAGFNRQCISYVCLTVRLCECLGMRLCVRVVAGLKTGPWVTTSIWAAQSWACYVALLVSEWLLGALSALCLVHRPTGSNFGGIRIASV